MQKPSLRQSLWGVAGIATIKAEAETIVLGSSHNYFKWVEFAQKCTQNWRGNVLWKSQKNRDIP